MLDRSLRLIVAAGVVSAVSAATVVPVDSASAATGQVGVVVSSGSSTVTKCVPAGGSGLTVLEHGFPNTEIGRSGPYAGFVLSINGVGKKPPDTTHYWSYWHSSGTGSWTYSSSGAGSYTPKSGTVEGWSYVSGQQAAKSPPAVTYASICGAAQPKPTRKHSPKPTHIRTATATHAATHAAVRPTTHATPKPTRKPARPATPPHAPASSLTITSAATSAATPASVVPPPTTSPLAHRQAERRSGTGFPAWGTIVAVIVVLALGGAAWLRLRHRPE